MDPSEEVALNNCDKEPVHIPGRIQPFGAMIGFDLESGRVRFHSENLGSMLSSDEATFIGEDYEQVISQREAVHAVRGALGLPTIRNQRERVGAFDWDSKRFDLAVYVTSNTAVVEFEPISRSSDPSLSPVSTVRSMMSAIRTSEGMEALLESSVKTLRMLTGHDRVMAYKFFENGDGEVVAEAKSPGVEPYLGLRYPAWDIPTQVRQIMLRAPFRVIEDIRAAHAGLVAAGDATPLDMTFSHLRGISPIYVEYLENMGVRATMNLCIIVRGRLWGMFAFHHYRPRIPTPDQRSICELFSQLASMSIQQEEERLRLARRQRTRSTIQSMSTATDALLPLVDRLSADLMEAVDADGVGVVSPDEARLLGSTTDEATAQTLTSVAVEEVVSVESLSDVPAAADGELGKTAGVLLLRLPKDRWLAFFRDEVVHEIRWAGEKKKEVELGPNGPRLTPRGSFAEYKESVSGRCHPWTESDLQVAGELCRELWKNLAISTTEQTRQLERQKQYQDLLIAELNHRVRNTLALVRSIARQTTQGATSIEQYIEMLEQRIAALSKAHDLIGGSGLQWARIEDLAQAELKPYEFETNRVTMSGSTLAVRADVAPLMALLFHEMVSNAVKHGALSPAGGSLNLHWFEDAGGVSIQWQEDLTRDVHEPQRRGFGLALIERALPYECNGRSSIHFGERQFKVDFWLPAETIDRMADQATAIPEERERPSSSKALDLSDLHSVLVLEDNMVLAMELERTLLELGVASVDTLASPELSRRAIESTDYDCAVMDIHFGEETSFDVAENLWNSGVAVVLVSGYGSNYDLPQSLARVPRLTKPVSGVNLVNGIREAKSIQS